MIVIIINIIIISIIIMICIMFIIIIMIIIIIIIVIIRRACWVARNGEAVGGQQLQVADVASRVGDRDLARGGGCGRLLCGHRQRLH